MPKAVRKTLGATRRGPQDNPAKRWCFTLNNYTQQELEHLSTELTDVRCEYAIAGLEKGENGTPHVQGFVHFKEKKRFTQVKKIVGDRCHLQIARGSNADNKRYCSKDGDVYLERGIVGSGQGTRNDLSHAVEVLRSSGSMSVLADQCPTAFIRYHRGFNALSSQLGLVKPRYTKTAFTVLVGPPGCGKSRWASDLANRYSDPPSVYYKNRGEWWDGYVQQALVIIDDYYGWLKYDEMLRLTDRYPMQVPIKGGYQQFTSKHVIVTSNVDMDKWYKFDGYICNALMRRCHNYLQWNGFEFIDLMDSPAWDQSTAYMMYCKHEDN